jgi:hypothetical protein
MGRVSLQTMSLLCANPQDGQFHHPLSAIPGARITLALTILPIPFERQAQLLTPQVLILQMSTQVCAVNPVISICCAAATRRVLTFAA